MGLRETLEAATPGPWTYRAQDGMVRDADAYFVVKVAGSPRNEELAASGRLAALAPELAAEVLELRERHREAMALVLDMGEALRKWMEAFQDEIEEDDIALLARLDQIGAADETRLGKEQT